MAEIKVEELAEPPVEGPGEIQCLIGMDMTQLDMAVVVVEVHQHLQHKAREVTVLRVLPELHGGM